MTRTRGFTLIELMIALAMAAIVIAIAYPNYQTYRERTNRSSAAAYLLNVAARQQQYHVDARTYGTLAEIGMDTPPAEVQRHYTVSLDGVPSASAFTVQAVPYGGQVNDGCGTLKLDQSGLQTVSGTTSAANCWGGK